MHEVEEIYLIEDHDQALKIWKKKGVEGLDLVHLDAHIDFAEYQARPPHEALQEAKSVEDLKRQLEIGLAFGSYEKDFNRQMNIGNYIYAAMRDGVVKNFWWVVPGGKQEFKKSQKIIKDIIKGIVGKNTICINNCSVYANYKSAVINVTYLNALPIFRQDVLLDIDVDYLTMPSLLQADPKENIGKLFPWITPQYLVQQLKEKICSPRMLTIAYSVSGGFTPMKYRYFGDEIAFRFSPRQFRQRYKHSLRAARYFESFCLNQQRKDYLHACRIDHYYRSADNNPGPLYLLKEKYRAAEKEFKRILKVDPLNPACLIGLADIALQRKEFGQAKKYFSQARGLAKGLAKGFAFGQVFKNERRQIFLGLGQSELGLKNYEKAKLWLMRYSRLEPLRAEPYYFLGVIAQKEKDFLKASQLYKDSIRLGYPALNPLASLAKICCRLEDKGSIIKYISMRLVSYKKEVVRLRQKRKKVFNRAFRDIVFRIERITRGNGC